MKTKFLILAVFVMMLCCITAVSAAENNMTEVALEDAIDDSGDELSIENTEILKDDEDNRIDAEINVTMPNNMKSGGWYEINVTMPVDADAYIDVYYEDSEEFISDTYIEEGRGQFSFNPPEMGGHYLRLNYYGNEIYNPKVYDIQFDISNYTLSIKDDRVEYSQNILVYLYSPRTFDGTVEVTINNKKYETQKGYENLYFYVNGDDLKLEDNHVNIYYKGDENFAPISVDTSLFMYNRSTFNISLEIPGNIKAPGESLFNVTISDKNLNLTVFENYDPWDGYGNEIEIINGKGTLSKYFWNMGQHEISIDFTGNEDYKPVHKSFTVFISNYTINVYNITYSPDANEIYFEVPDSFEYDFNVTMDGKPYTAKFDGEERGAHYIAVDDLTYGKHEANIYFEGKDQFHELNVTKTFYVKSEIGLTNSVIDWNTSGGFYIDLPADATGELVAYRYDYETKQCGERLGSVEITEGQGFLNLGNWSIGEYCLHVTYENSNYAVEPISTDVNVRPQITYSNYVLDKNNAKVKVNADGGNLTVYGNGGKQVGFVQVNGPTNISINMGNYNYFEIVYLKDNYEYSIDFEITVIDLSVNFNKSLPKFANGFRVYSDDSCYFDYCFDGNYKGEYDIDEYWQGYVNIPFDEGDLTLGEHTIELKFGDESKKITFTVFDANISVPTYFFKGQDSNLTIQMPEEMGGNVTGYLGTHDDWESDTITYSQFFSQNVTDEPIIVSLDDLKAGYRNIKLVYDNGETTFENYYVIRVLDMDISIENNTVISSSTSGFNYNVYGYYDSVEYRFDNQDKGTYDYSGTISFDQGDLIDGNHTIEFKVRTDDGTELSKKITFYVFSLNVTIPKYVQKREDAFIAVKVSDKSPANVTAYLTDSGNPEKIESAQLSDGQVNISLNQLSSGYHNIRVVYEGDAFNITKDIFTTVLDISTSIKNNTVILSNTDNLDVGFGAYFADSMLFKFDGVEKQAYNPEYNIQIPLSDCDLSEGVHTIELILSW